MPTVIDITGKRFGKLVVNSYAGRRATSSGKQLRSMWNVTCDCGTCKQVEGSKLKTGDVVSCGCHRHALLHSTTHGMTHSGVYSCWVMMIRRCTRKEDKDYYRYGGRGITVCPEWFDIQKFAEDMGPRPPGFTLDRRDNNLGYSKENCRWATIVGQANNTRDNHLLTLNGETFSASEWAYRLGISISTIFGRISRGLPVEDVLSTESLSRRSLTLKNPVIRIHSLED